MFSIDFLNEVPPFDQKEDEFQTFGNDLQRISNRRKIHEIVLPKSNKTTSYVQQYVEKIQKKKD